MNTEKLKQFFESKDFLVHTFEHEGQQCAELECWTNKGVNMIISLIPFTAESFIDYVDNFDVDEEIDVHRQDERYKKAFSLGVSLDDFNAYANMLDTVASSLKEAEKPKHLYIRLNVRDGEREHTHHCVTSTTCESLEFAVVWYAAHFWGQGEMFREHADEFYFMFDNEIAVEVETWKELTDEEANFLNQIMY
jgi:hypothetical protein